MSSGVISLDFDTVVNLSISDLATFKHPFSKIFFSQAIFKGQLLIFVNELTVFSESDRAAAR